MPNPQPQGARAATPLEVAEWEKFKRYYNTVLSKAVLRAKTAAEIANQGQAVVDKYGLPGFIYDSKSLAHTQDLLNRFNIIGRYITGVESGKYAIRIKGGDIDILAPSSMSVAEYEADIYPAIGLGVIPVIVWVLGVGTVLVGGIWAVSKIMESVAENQEATNTGRFIDADKEMIKLPDNIRNAWIDFRKKMAPVAKQVGILEEIFGSEAVGKIAGGLGLGLLLILGAFAFTQRKRT